jgi:hypothetical protein
VTALVALGALGVTLSMFAPSVAGW